MLKGALITNAFLRTDKFVEHYEWLKEAAEQQGIALSLFCNADLMMTLGSYESVWEKEQGKKAEGVSEKGQGFRKELEWLEGLDFILYWDKDIEQGNILSDICNQKNIRIFNTVESIGVSDHKYETYRKLWHWNMLHPEKKIELLPTIMAPMTYENIGYTNLEFLDYVIDMLGLPLIIKECYGSFGMQVYLARDRKEVVEWTKKLAGKPFLYQKYLKESSGKDVRLQVVGERVIAGMMRYSEQGDFRANLTNGGSMKPYQYREEEADIAVRAVRVLGLDFAGVDLLFTGQAENQKACVVCEVNSNAHFKNIYECTGVNVADEIIRHIKCVCTGTK